MRIMRKCVCGQNFPLQNRIRHLGYRYVIQDTALDSSDFQIRLENVGFSVCYRKLDLQLTLVSSDGEVFSFPISSDSRFWIPGTTAELSISLPLARLTKGSYTVYFQMTLDIIIAGQSVKNGSFVFVSSCFPFIQNRGIVFRIQIGDMHAR